MIPFKEDLTAKPVRDELSVKFINSTRYSVYGEKAYNDLG